MKKYFYAIITTILFISACKKNSSDDVIPTPVGYQWPNGTSEYAPYTDGSTFTFETSFGTPVVVDSFTYTVTKDTTINSLTFKKLVSDKPALGTTYYVNSNAGIETEIDYNFNFQGIVIPSITQIVLKENAALNAVWKDSLIVNVPFNGLNIPVPVSFNNMVLQKDITKNILNKDYLNSFEIKQIISIPQQYATAANLSTNNVQVYNFFAKGVGRVQRETNNSTLKIKRYNVIK